MADLPSTTDMLKAHGLWAKKSLGQHFLLDTQLLDTIAGYAGDVAGYQVIEVGPGPSGLTRALLKRGAKVLAIEKDTRFIPFMELLRQHYPEQFDFIIGDATRIDITEVSPAPRKIVANLPYNVGSVLLMDWLKHIAESGGEAIAQMTLMFQKEVAERIAAEPSSKAYGRLAVMSQFCCDVTWHQDLPAEAFTPPPKIASSVISLVPKTPPAGMPRPSFAAMEKTVACAFNQRRKMLRVALKPLGVDVAALLEKANIEGTLRAENLSIADFERLALAATTSG